MLKISKKEFASYPEFAMYVDYSAKKDPIGFGYKMLQAGDALEAMREAEKFIQSADNGSIYLVIIAKKEGVQGCLNSTVVTYRETLITRVSYVGGQVEHSNWHFTDEAHCEREGDELKAIKAGSNFDIWR